MQGDISLVLRVLIAVVFLGASASKIADVGRFERTLRTYPYLGHWSRIVSGAVPAVELLIGLGLATGMWYREMAIASAVFLGIVTLAIVSLWRARKTVEACGCGGLIPEGISPRLHIAVNVGLAACALVIAFSSETVGGLSTGAPLEEHVRAPSQYSALALVSELVLGATAVTAFAVGQVRRMQIYQLNVERDA